MANLDPFKGTYPYASELFGVYQPLLGWKSRQGKERATLDSTRMIGEVMAGVQRDGRLHKYALQQPAAVAIDTPVSGRLPTWMDSTVARIAQAQVNGILTKQKRPPTSDEWKQILSAENITKSLQTAAREVNVAIKAANLKMICGDLVFFEKNALSAEEFNAIGAAEVPGANRMVTTESRLQFDGKLQAETTAAGTLQYLLNTKPELLNGVFVQTKTGWERLRNFIDPLATFDPQTQQAVLSPVGMVHLYRQYFFEFDSFLGPPVGHVWISPGSTVELIEVSTRRTVTERYLELFRENSTRSELETVQKEDLASVVKQENQRSMDLGVSAGGGGDFGVYHFEASANFGFQTTQLKSQEEAHKYMRQQSERLTNEVRSQFRTSFRTVTEVEDQASRRYKLENSTDQLVNFELKRKMRRVGVQVQHVGSQLCWQVYLDDPGVDLGIAELVHVAKPADATGTAQPPEAPVALGPTTTEVTVNFPYQADGTDDDRGATFYEGSDHDSGLRGSPERIIWRRSFSAPPPGIGYSLNPNGVQELAIERVDPDRDPPEVAAQFEVIGDNRFRISLPQINFHDQPSIRFVLELLWDPPDQSDALAAYRQKVDEYTAQQQREQQTALLDAVKERIELASEVEPRPGRTLRREERIVVFRRLIRQLMGAGSNQGTHVTAELVRSLFEVDRMLYFVAPDWWRARRRERGRQQLVGGADGTTAVSDQDVVGWGGARAQDRDNYLITDQSRPAPLGASIGWLMQLDGDEHRNAFLNSPWIKAVIPVRPGREVAALNWLKKAQVEGADGLDAAYQGPEPELNGKPLQEVLNTLARDLAKQNADVKNVLATETVFETGFNPLAGGFAATGKPFEIFDQWVEVLPTDQIVAVNYPAP